MNMNMTSMMMNASMSMNSSMGGMSGMKDMDMGGMKMNGMDMGCMNMSNMKMDMDMDMMGMKMYFHLGYKEYVLLKECATSSTGGMAGACFFIFAVGFLYEGLKFMRQELLLKMRTPSSPKVATISGNGVNEFIPGSGDVVKGSSMRVSLGGSILSASHLLQTFLHMIQVFVSYCLMLVFMTYNVWLCLSVMLGAGAGYFFFGWKKATVVDSNEHCH